MTPESGGPERVLVLAPTRRDAELTMSFLGEAGVVCECCAGMTDLCREVGAGAGAILLTQEAMAGPGSRLLENVLAEEPSWSDPPVLLLCDRGADSPVAARALDRLGNVIILERPVRLTTLVSTVRTALRARRRQYELREQIAALKQAGDTVRESERRFRTMADGLPLIVWVHDADGSLRYVNRTYCEFFGVEPDEVVGENWKPLMHPDDAPAYTDEFVACLRERRPFSAEVRVKDATGRWRTIHSWGRPRFSGDGEFLGMVGSSADVTDRNMAEEKLRRSEERLHAAQKAGAVGTFEWDIRTNENTWSPELESLYGLDAGGFGGTFEAFAALVHPDDLPGVERDVQTALEQGELESEWRVALPDGSERWLEARGWVDRDGAGRPLRMIGVNVDVTERKRHEEHLRTVMAELNHRVKNTLAVVDSLARQTARGAPDFETFTRTFGERLRSMASAHGLLTRSQWLGAQIQDILDNELSARAAGRHQYQLDGPAVTLRPKAALAINMMTHELATNALKYGALRGTRGKVIVRWRFERFEGEPGLRLEWGEHCARDIEPSARRGFGTRLIGRLARYELSGEVRSEFADDGLRCTVTFPFDDGRSERKKPETGPTRTATGPRILLVEDNFTLAMAVCNELEGVGVQVIGPAGRLAEARALAEENGIDAAVLDVDLNGTPVFPLARELRGRGVPFVLLTGYEREDMPEDLRDAPMFAKPLNVDALVDDLSEVLSIDIAS